MDEINFVNGQEPALNGANLNKLQKNIKPNKTRLKLTSAVAKRWNNNIVFILQSRDRLFRRLFYGREIIIKQ
mgnify:CR=1 FL=1